MIKILFMGTPQFAVPSLQRLIDDPRFCVSAVVAQEDKKGHRGRLSIPPVKMLAQSQNIPVFQPPKVNDSSAVEALADLDVDFVVVIAYGQIIGKKLLETFPDRIINMHASLLPAYRGAAPINWAILNGEKETGVTSMLIERGLDTGDMLFKKSVEIGEDDALALTARLSELSAEVLIETLTNFDALYRNREVQDDAKASHAAMLSKNMGHLRFNVTGTELKNRVRGLVPWPGSFVIYKDQAVKIHKIDIISKYNDTEEGILYQVGSSGLYVNTKDATVVIEELQFPGKKRMTATDYLKGNKIDSIKLE